jgi:branched-chain amino acid transport system substrate-binding protein
VGSVVLVSDDATDPATGAAEARWLVRAGCRVVLAGVTSATFGAVQRAIGDCGVPLVRTVLNEGGGGPGHVFRWGERPADQLAVAAAPLMRSSGARQWFLVGDDYSWSHGAHRAARQVLPEACGVSPSWRARTAIASLPAEPPLPQAQRRQIQPAMAPSGSACRVVPGVPPG